MRLITLALLLTSIAAEDHDDHEDHEFEWAGQFHLEAGTFSWTAAKVDGAYADASMKMALLETTTHGEEGIEAVESVADTLLAGSCTQVSPGDGTKIVPSSTECYQLMFDDDVYMSMYEVEIATAGDNVFFCEHYPIEFELESHFLKDDHGDDIEPEAEWPSADDDDDDDETRWGDTMGACFAVTFCTLVGIVAIAPPVRATFEKHADAFTQISSAFAAGALLACAVFLMFIEGSHFIAVGKSTEVATTWRWGTAVLAGWVLGAVVNLSTGAYEHSRTLTVEVKDPEEGKEGGLAVAVAEGGKETSGQAVTVATAPQPTGLILAVLLGDFVHNFADGIFIGAAFTGCGSGFGWSVSLATILHELPQELADFFVLTDPKCGGLAVPVALALNFASGLGCVLGGIVACASDINGEALGMLLTAGGGVYMYIAASECAPRFLKPSSPQLAITAFAAFVGGAILIGLVLLDHAHCEAGGDDDEGGGDGHDH